MRVVLLDSAEQDLKELRGYLLRQFDQQAWKASLRQFREAVDTIRAFPQRGSMPDELLDLSLSQYRQVIAGMNRIIYEIRGDTAYIHIVCDTRRDMKSLLSRRLLRADLRPAPGTRR